MTLQESPWCGSLLERGILMEIWYLTFWLDVLRTFELEMTLANLCCPSHNHTMLSLDVQWKTLVSKIIPVDLTPVLIHGDSTNVIVFQVVLVQTVQMFVTTLILARTWEFVIDQLLVKKLTLVSVDDSSLVDTVRSAYSNLALQPGGATRFVDHATVKGLRGLIQPVTKQQVPAIARQTITNPKVVTNVFLATVTQTVLWDLHVIQSLVNANVTKGLLDEDVTVAQVVLQRFMK